MKNLPRFVTDSRTTLVLALVASLLVLTGCGDDDIEVYDAPRPATSSNMPATDPHSHADMGQPHAEHADQPAAQPQPSGPLAFTMPEGWQQATPGPMILNQFTTPSGAEVKVSAFPGDVGGIVANVNRWRRQLGMAPADEAQINASLKPDKLSTFDASRVDLANDTQRMIVSFGMVEGKTWFFKLTGTTQQIDAALPAFDQFMKSVNWK